MSKREGGHICKTFKYGSCCRPRQIYISHNLLKMEPDTPTDCQPTPDVCTCITETPNNDENPMRGRPANMSSMLTLLQISDSGFPTGGFSHSMGYEAALKQGHVTSMGKFKQFVLSTLENAGSSSIPFVKSAYLNSSNMTKIKSLDQYCEACLNNHVANKASIQQGKSLIATSCEAFQDGRIKQIKTSINEGRIRGHHAIMFGCLCSFLNITLSDCLEMYMFNTLRTVMASAVRLGNLGPLEAQQIQYKMQHHIGNIIERNFDCPVEETAISFPMVDIVQNTHDTLFSKLFVS